MKQKKLIAVEVKNDSDKGIIAISLSSRGTKHSYTVTLRTSFEAGAEQQVVLAPQKTAVLRIEVANINKDRPLEIGAVMYADGTAEGCKYFLDLLKEIQLEERTKKISSSTTGILGERAPSKTEYENYLKLMDALSYDYPRHYVN